MSPPTSNGTNLRQRTDGFVGSSSSSTGTVPRVSDSRMNGGGVGGVGGGGRPSEQPPRATNLNPRSLRQQSQQLERLLMEQQAKLMSLGQQNSNDQRQQDRSENPKYLTESLQDLKEKLELLQSFNSSSHSENHEQQQPFDFQQPQQRPSRYDNVGVGIVGQSEFLNNMQRYHHHQLLDNAAMVEPFFSSMGSPSRPRRKQKINREQNVSSSNAINSRSRPEAAMVFPMPQQQQAPTTPAAAAPPPPVQQPIARPSSGHHHQQQQQPQPLQNEVQPMMHQRQQQVSMNPVVTSIKRSIYTHVNELIAQNEERPEQLARIYHNLQNINCSTEMAMANLNNSTLSSSGGGVGAGGNHNRRPPWGSMYRDVEDDDLEDLEDLDDEDEEENNVVTSSTSLFKNIKTFNAAVLASSSSISTPATNDNRLALLAASSAADIVNSSGESSLIQEEEHQQHQQDRFPLFSYEGSSGIHDSLASLGAVGGASSISSGTVEPLENNNVIKKQVNNLESDAKQQNVTIVAVPKNIQRNIISRERDDRRKIRHREREPKPRNMMGSVPTSVLGTDPHGHAAAASTATSSQALQQAPPPSNSSNHDMGFIPIKFRNDCEQGENAVGGATGGDQDHSGSLEMEVGLDRVPTRLSSSELEAGRRQEEDENLQNLVDEVLNSTSSEVDFIVGNSDLS